MSLEPPSFGILPGKLYLVPRAQPVIWKTRPYFVLLQEQLPDPNHNRPAPVMGKTYHPSLFPSSSVSYWKILAVTRVFSLKIFTLYQLQWMKIKGKKIVQVQEYQRLLTQLWLFLLSQAGLFVLGPTNAYTQIHTGVDVSIQCQKMCFLYSTTQILCTYRFFHLNPKFYPVMTLFPLATPSPWSQKQ